MIYAIEILDCKFVKIGYCGDESASSRIAQLQTGSPYRLKELFVIPGTIYQEKALHSALKIAFGRVHIPMPPNEWYPGKTPFFQQFLHQLKFGMDIGLAFAEAYNPMIKQPGKKEQLCKPDIRWPIR